MIRLDATQFSVVAVCSLCPWRSLAGDRLTGAERGRRHNATDHPNDQQTAAAARQQAYRARKAAGRP
ncbi:hypothetical protein SEA_SERIALPHILLER_3 [Arthrobacter phage SerialPhiller]|nr:hypothetical protein SEA_KELS_3 [Arthrobacter phage Kels]WNO27586.1 hypothetical protein SEA_ARIELAGOS_3 [Arthrobacter phage Arielagos]WNT45235.1 hypothetical protein SEA_SERIALPHILLER_3 [Arthrobacter phage SerialPhiller]